MSHAGHKIVMCSDCGKIISQCRCAEKNKPVYYDICKDCKTNLGDDMEEKKGPSKAEILKMAIDGLSPKDKEEFNKLIASTMEKRPVNNKIELQRG